MGQVVASSGLPCTPSYANLGGTGDRTVATGNGSIVVTDNSIPSIGDSSKWVNGVIAPEGNFFNSGALPVGRWFQFDFGSGKSVLITEAKYYQETSVTQGVWKWQYSDDTSSWTDVGSSFTLGGTTTQTITELSGNTTKHRYYRIITVSGNGNSGPWVYEFEFKICGIP